MGFVHRAFVAAGVGFAVAAIAGCGSSGGQWLSQSQASRLTEQLNSLEQSLSGSECAAAQRAVTQFQDQVSALNGVNSTLIANLNQGASTIQTLASRDCPVGVATTPKKTHPKTHTTTSPTTTTATQPTQTNTQPSTTYTQPSDTTTSTLPSTSTNGGQGLGGATDTTSSTSTPTTGGSGLGNTDTTATGAGTSSTDTTANAVGTGAAGGSGGGY